MNFPAKNKVHQQLSVLSPEALDFAPDLLAIQERAPQRLPRVLLILVVVLLASLGIWSTIAKLDVIAVADGRLVPLTFTKVVQPAEQGVVTDIAVKDGDTVKQGQILLRLDPRINNADTTALNQDVAVKKLTLRRIDAELRDSPMQFDKRDLPELYARINAQFAARRKAYTDSLAQEQEAMNRANADLRSASQVRDKLAQTLPTYKKSADAFATLEKDGYVGPIAAAEKAREAIEKEQDLKAQESTLQGLQAAIAQSEKRMAVLRSQYRSQLENERLETVSTLNKSAQELEKSAVRATLLEIRAPASGVVKDIATTSKGAVVAAGALLMNIVPQDEPLQAEVLLKNEDAGFVAKGQKAMVKVAAYPFQKYGMLEGVVDLISADSTDPRQGQVNQQAALAYRAIVRITDPVLRGGSTAEKLTLSPGMLVAAEINQGQRTVLEYLLSPVAKVRQEAGRER
jgi:hemolysin D